LLAACDELTDEQFHQRFDMGPGSLHDTMAHIIGAMERWRNFLAGRESTTRFEDTKHTVEEMGHAVTAVCADLQLSVDAHANDEVVTGSRGGKTYSFTRGGVLTHVTTHGMHHRAQCMNMLRQLGVEKLPPSAVVEWMFMVDGPATTA
jgi:uncharacterized damage-inducible protein DinB